MKKYICLIMLFLVGFLTTSCKKEEIRTIKIYNWVDYIDETVLDEFVEYYKELTGETIGYVYDTFETNESILLNKDSVENVLNKLVKTIQNN